MAAVDTVEQFLKWEDLLRRLTALEAVAFLLTPESQVTLVLYRAEIEHSYKLWKEDNAPEQAPDDGLGARW